MFLLPGLGRELCKCEQLAAVLSQLPSLYSARLLHSFYHNLPFLNLAYGMVGVFECSIYDMTRAGKVVRLRVFVEVEKTVS